MMEKLLALFVLLPCLVWAGSPHFTISQQREVNETMEQAVARISKQVPKSLWAKESPYSQRMPLVELDFSLVPRVSTYAELLAMFYFIRDNRFLYEDSLPFFARRISWLYPDDGCFARAAITGMSLESAHFVRPAKIFAFGSLSLQTAFSLSGEVHWWYHVAAVVSYMDSIYVLDPALNTGGPMLYSDWYNTMGMEGELTGVVCNPHTYDPFDHCYKMSGKSDSYARRDQSKFLEKEWGRMHNLGYEPLQILGNNPPWD